jgi:hypothetical protein
VSPFPTDPDVDASVTIDAPIEVVWRVMLDLDAYPQWNPFVVRIEGPAGRPPALGDDLVLHVRWQSGRTTSARERITAIEPPAPVDGVTRAILVYEFRGWPYYAGLARGRRTQTVEQTAGGPTTYRTTEHFGGLLRRTLPVRSTQEGFERHAAALRSRAESLA